MPRAGTWIRCADKNTPASWISFWNNLFVFLVTLTFHRLYSFHFFFQSLNCVMLKQWIDLRLHRSDGTVSNRLHQCKYVRPTSFVSWLSIRYTHNQITYIHVRKRFMKARHTDERWDANKAERRLNWACACACDFKNKHFDISWDSAIGQSHQY